MLPSLVTVMPRTSQSLELHEQVEKEVASQEASGKIVANPPGISHSTLEVRSPDPVLYDSFKEAIYVQPRPLSSDEKVLATQEQAPYQAAKGRRRICGLQPKYFWFILVSAVFVTVVVVGAVVGTVVQPQ